MSLITFCASVETAETNRVSQLGDQRNPGKHTCLGKIIIICDMNKSALTQHFTLLFVQKQDDQAVQVASKHASRALTHHGHQWAPMGLYLVFLTPQHLNDAWDQRNQAVRLVHRLQLRRNKESRGTASTFNPPETHAPFQLREKYETLPGSITLCQRHVSITFCGFFFSFFPSFFLFSHKWPWPTFY